MTNTRRALHLALGLALAGILLLHCATSRAQSGPGASTYEFVVNSAWDRGAPGAMPSTPEGQPPESAWRPASGPRYTLALTSGGQRVELRDGATTLTGHLESRGPGGRRYVLDQGAFAGGRFVLSDDGARGELLVYGSGVPLVRGERGTVVHRP